MVFRPLAQASHALCEGASLKFLIFSPSGIRLMTIRPMWHMSWYCPHNLRLPQPCNKGANTIDNAGQTFLRQKRRSPSYYGFNSFSLVSAIAAPPKRPRRAGDVDNFQPPLHRLSKQCRTFLYNNLKRPTFLHLSEKFHHLLRKCYHLSIRIPRHGQSLERKIKRCLISHFCKQNCSHNFAIKTVNSKFNITLFFSYDNQYIYCYYVFNRGPSFNL